MSYTQGRPCSTGNCDTRITLSRTKEPAIDEKQERIAAESQIERFLAGLFTFNSPITAEGCKTFSEGAMADLFRKACKNGLFGNEAIAVKPERVKDLICLQYSDFVRVMSVNSDAIIFIANPLQQTAIGYNDVISKPVIAEFSVSIPIETK